MTKSHHVRVGHLVDGSGGPIQKDMLLTVRDGVFVDIERFAEDMVLDPSAVTDLSLCTILPPLIDCHTHLSMSGTTDQQTRKQQITTRFVPALQSTFTITSLTVSLVCAMLETSMVMPCATKMNQRRTRKNR